MKNASLYTCLIAGVLLTFAGCATAPDTEANKTELHSNVESAMTRIKALDPSLQKQIANAYGYAMFPSVAKGGAIVGGAYGRGEVYEQGKMVGWADLSQATIGAQLGGQSFSELILFENKAALDNFRNGKLKFAANASAVALKSGAADTARYTDGVLVFAEPKAGLMVEATLGGQAFSFQPV
ncbi:MAG TPA: lipid-binding SYLF domain-containing protein [Burkholderiales bacterium]|nr:lipid-binding SYLF domain-containing protein [Burkholderiales bacterium]